MFGRKHDLNGTVASKSPAQHGGILPEHAPRMPLNEKNRWYAPASRVRVHFPANFRVPEMQGRNNTMAFFARNPLGITVVFFLFALYNLGESVEKSKYGCSVCKNKSQPSPFQKAKAYTNAGRNASIIPILNQNRSKSINIDND